MSIGNDRDSMQDVLMSIDSRLAELVEAVKNSRQVVQVPDNTLTLVAEWVRSGSYKVSCSNCGAVVSLAASKDMNYCFKCGAFMRGDDKTDNML